ncbi:hypothetical protein GCM10023187_53850 [Nibrella viscosa]|uniref:Peptidase metallopeptidase domain-containing protein n=1 Tax=Nibrella viscosa TaxID=1084524 RepID=A0ABP8KZN7_9BACT
MKNIYKALTAFLLIITTKSLTLGQGSKKESALYDDWPVTVSSNLTQGKKNTNVSAYFSINRSWNHRILTYYFQNGTNDIAGDGERQAIRQAFDLWASQTDIAFLEVCNEASADIRILWTTGNHGDNQNFDGRYDGIVPNLLAHGNPPPLPGSTDPLDGDLHFDDDEDWTDLIKNNNQQPIDLVTVAAHEIGHILGLNHSTASGALMNASYTGSHRYLSSDDIAGVQSMYGAKGTGSIITGSNYFCSTNVLTLQEVPPGTTINWSVTPAFSFANSSGTGASANLTVSGQLGSKYAINYSLQSGCGSTTINRENLWVSNPGLQQMTYGTEGTGQTNTVYSVNMVSPGTWYILRTNTELAQLTSGPFWNPSSSINGYSPNQGEYRFNLTPGQSVNLTVAASNSCGSASRTITFTVPSSYFVAPNPAQNSITIQFDKVDYFETLPEQIVLINEKNTSITKIVNMKDLIKEQTFRENRKVEIDVRHLPRGTYYLHFKSANIMNKVDNIVRILLN